MKYHCHKCNETLGKVILPRCPKCGNVYDLIYNYPEKSHILKELFENKKINHWKYHYLLPINYHNTTHILTFDEGGVPLLNFNQLKPNGVDNLFFKMESQNPTGSFKDRASSLEVTLAQGSHGIIVATTGNMGSSLAAYSALAGLPCIVFIPEGIHNSKIEQMKIHGARIIPVKGDYTAAMLSAEQYYLDHSGYYLAGDYAIRIEGTKTIGFEICDQLDWNVPDYIIVPVGNGTLLWSTYKAFLDLNEIGIINGMPKLIGVESINPSETIASAIACPKPSLEYVIKHAAHTIITVTDNEIMIARNILGKNGVYVEPGGAVAFAGMKKVHIEGDVVLVLTGHGLKGI